MRMALACSSVLGLLAVASGGSTRAVPAEAPLLTIHSSSSLRGGNTVIVDLQFPSAWPDASVEIAVPPGYTGSATPVPFGRPMSHLIIEGVRADGPAVQQTGGKVTVEDPQRYEVEAQRCAPGRHDAVWLLGVDVDGQRFETPIWVDRLDGGSPAGSFRLSLCPDLRLGSIAITRLTIATKAFWNPSTAGTYVWRGRFTSATKTERLESIVRLPVALRLTSVRRRDGTLSVAGRAFEGSSPLVAAPVRVWGRLADRSTRQVALVRTKPDGTFLVRSRSRALSVYARLVLGERGAECVASASPCRASAAIPFPLETPVRAVRR